eukprot:450956_1
MDHFQAFEPIQRTACSKCGDCIIILVILALALSLQNFTPNEQYIPGYNDDNTTVVNYTFDYPDVTSSVPMITLLIIDGVPWVILAILDMILLKLTDKKFNWIDVRRNVWLMIRTFWFCIGITFLSGDLIKVFVGSPRPYYF